jgi:DNA-binding MarR family transcriptional regulator
MSNSKSKSSTKNFTTGYYFNCITNDWQKKLNSILISHNLDTVKYSLLNALNFHTFNNLKATQVLLSKHAMLDKMTTSKMMRLMEEQKLLKRKESKIDTRAKIVELTDKGKKLYDKATLIVEKFEKEYFDKLYKIDKNINRKLAAVI